MLSPTAQFAWHTHFTIFSNFFLEISLESNLPYSPRYTCGECHDYDVITNAYHFAKSCGACHPGGGCTEYDRKGNRYDEFAKGPENGIFGNGDNFLDGDYYQSNWAESGVLEADCLICHLPNYDWQARALSVRGGFFYEAPTFGAGWFRDLEATTPLLRSEKPKAVSLRADYTQTARADPADLAEFITREVADENCWNCHAGADIKKRGRTWDPETDVHKARGLTCAYCHPAGEDHEIAKGHILAGSVRDDIDGGMHSCRQCHVEGQDNCAPSPTHQFSNLHIEKISCETCHVPYKYRPATSVIDNATTGHTISYFTSDYLSDDPLQPMSNRSNNTWCPAFVKHEGEIKPLNPMQAIWWGDWDRASRRVIPIILERIRDVTGANLENGYTITNFALL